MVRRGERGFWSDSRTDRCSRSSSITPSLSVSSSSSCPFAVSTLVPGGSVYAFVGALVPGGSVCVGGCGGVGGGGDC